MDADVVVVGAGLSGLQCARSLRDAGREVVVLDEADAVGGRIRTERVDGFLVDRGFQLLNPAYPAVRRWVDVAALDLQGFGAGVVARTDRGATRLGDPRRSPGLLPASAAAAAPRPAELLALARWAMPAVRPTGSRTRLDVVSRRPDVDRATALDRAGADGLLRRVVDRFLAGVLLEDDGSTADRFTQLLLSSFVRGTPSLPRGGMQALPEQLAALLGGSVRLGVRAREVTGTRVVTDTGEWTARAVVVATGGAAAERLTGLPAPADKGVVTTWWAAPEAPDTSLLHVDGRVRPEGPLVNAAVVSRAAPSYAPSGRHLVQGSALMSGSAGPDEQEMRQHAADLLGTSASSWDVVARHEVPHALPAQPVPFAPSRPVVVGDLVVCGDHRDTGSIQGALVSGQRAASAVLARLG